ncbi:unnamed protein product [Pseudo-nitzschia multistriata]|uniref:Uncharacterized protein n=1 Tax=Pseudo-nitzschia multistriata TaxID=183589 RepID=A0A448ZMP0_9STRA|nr:unnamed protein product [Pseudo-nitzschia multistriata]
MAMGHKLEPRKRKTWDNQWLRNVERCCKHAQNSLADRLELWIRFVDVDHQIHEDTVPRSLIPLLPFGAFGLLNVPHHSPDSASKDLVQHRQALNLDLFRVRPRI